MKIDLNTLLLVGGGIALYHYSTLSKDKQKEIKQKIGIEPKYTEPTPPVIDDVPVVTTPAPTPSLPINWCGTGRFPVSTPDGSQVCTDVNRNTVAPMQGGMTQAQIAQYLTPGIGYNAVTVQSEQERREKGISPSEYYGTIAPLTAPQSQADCGTGLVFDRRYPCGIPGCDWIEECITPEEKALRDAAPPPPSARPMGFSGFTGINNEHQPGNFLTDDPGDIQSMTEFINDVP